MVQLRDDPPLIYTNGSTIPTPGDTVPQLQLSNTNPAPMTEAGSSTPASPAERGRKPSRTSSLLSTLTPPFSRRVGRAPSVTKANGKPVIDIHAALRNTPSKESNLTAASQSVGEETSPNEGIASLDAHGDQRVNDLEKANTIFAEPKRDGDLTKSMRKLSRRVSDSGARKMNSAIGIFKRRMGLGHDAGEASTSFTNENVEPLETPPPAQNKVLVEPIITGASLSPPKDSGRSVGRTPSVRDKWKKGKAHATDTFEFAATFSSPKREGEGDNPVMMDSPTGYREGANDTMKPVSKASNRPRLLHTTSTPLRHSFSSLRKDDSAATVMPSTVPREDFIALDEISVPEKWLTGTEMYKVSEKGTKLRKFILDPDQGFILWKSKKSGIIRIENITELRPGSHARYNMEQLNRSKADEDRWLTITYLADGKYKALHLIALTSDDFKSFYETLGRLRSLRIAMLALPSDTHLPPTPHFQPADTGHSNGTAEVHDEASTKSPPKALKLLPVHTIHKHLTNEQRQNLWERHYWKGADVSVDGRVDLQEIKRMAHRLSIDNLSHDLDTIFKEIHQSGGAGMNLEEFRMFWRRLRTRGDLQIVWNRMAGEEKVTFQVFERFMRTDQKDTRSSEELERVFAHYASTVSDSANRKSEPPVLLLTLEGFTAYLMSSDNAPFSDQNLGVYHDMDRPLSEYYISSSHNTYLVGHQLVGESSIEGYIRALLNSCRCVEIDIYDGDREPMITHGGTLTSKIPLRVICEAIEKSAFVTSPYPVIISAEVHCGVVQQHAIAEIMKDVFKEKLVVERIDDKNSTEPLKRLPSPQMLMNRILLKTKNPAISQGNVIDISTEATEPAILAETDASTCFTSDPEPQSPERRGSFSLTRGRRGSRSHALTPVKPVGISQDRDATGESFEGSLPPEPRTPNSPKTKVFSQSLAGLLVYTVGVKCRGINKKEHYAVEHMFSLSEKKVDKMLKEGSVYYAGADDSEHPNADAGVSGGMLDLIKHCQTHLVRIYPKGTRLNSTNYIPHRYWAAGAQLVAINWQTSDLGSMINQAMFLRNGKSGYVLKPTSLRSEHKIKDAVSKRKTYALELTIISAQQLPRPRDKDGRDIIDKSTMDPFVQVALYVPDWPGAPPPKSGTSQEDKELLSTQMAGGTSLPKSSSLRRSMDYKPATSSSRYVLQSSSTPAKVIRVQTDSVKNNGFNPSWQTCLRLKFEVSGDMLDLVFIRFSVRDEGDAEDERALAMYCISLGSLKQGYRHLPLHDQQMTQYLFSTLFIHTNLQEINV